MTEDNASFSPLESGHFQPSYKASRASILQRASATSGIHPLLTDSRTIASRGPEGETLALDFMIFGARQPRHVLVVSSATHGVEGFCGSAIQHQLISEQLPGITLGSDTAVIVQHANNPYGFAWLRRVSENNVDINRNFRDRFDEFDVSPGYEQLFDALNPTDLDPDNEAMRWATIARYIEEHGLRTAQQAIIEGQYKYPQGLQFGGHRKDECVAHLQDLVREHLAAAQTVYWVDIHTGLGEFGACESISSFEPEHPNFQTAARVWGDAVRSSRSGDSISTPLRGVMDRGLAGLMADDCQFGFIAAEFGTYPVERVLRALRADNWLHQHGPDDLLGDPVAREIKAEILEALRPDRAEWRMRVLETGRKIIDQAIAALPGADIIER
ncbi:MAG: DUF2817 domain-containing protein [Burkholderiaceae bacterium]